MKTETDLRKFLKEIDHKGYPAYKGIRGKYHFRDYVLSIDHVQGDPFAAPSKVSVIVDENRSGFKKDYYNILYKRVAFQDLLLRRFAKEIKGYSFQAKGSGKSGLISISQPGQEILHRSACNVEEESGEIVVRFEVGFPANGRTINARELEKILFDFLPKCVEKSFFAKAYRTEEIEEVLALAEDQEYIRNALAKMGLVAFVANGSVLPRKSGVSMLPMKEAIPFQSPKSLEVTLELPNYGVIKGMGIRKGITLIVGGGYHGKSTLLKALELGVYNHIRGDGREYVITDGSAVKLRAEDGRSIQKTDISMFIQNLPNGRNTKKFYTEDASGSTSQAANTIEALEAGAEVFLIDEDTSATNFMVRDELMQRVVSQEVEPIIPFIDRVKELYTEYGISTILVAGSSGSYFHKADTVIQMKNYEPIEITEFAKKEAESYPLVRIEAKEAGRPSFERVVKKDAAFAKENRIKMKVMGKEGFSIQRENVDLRYVEQICDSEQVNAFAEIVKYMKRHIFDGTKTVHEAVEEFYHKIEKQEFGAFCEGDIPGNLVLPRKQELYAVLNRCRGLIRIE